VAINPATPASVLEEILPDLDQVLVMTVNPGFGHQHFLQSTLPKLRRVAQMIERIKPECDLEVDGGIEGHGCNGSRSRGQCAGRGNVSIFCRQECGCRDGIIA